MEDPSSTKYAIHEACRQGQTQKVESLLSANPKLALLSDPDSRLPLHWATSHNHAQIVTLLASTPRFDVDATDASGWTPLMMASSRRAADADALVALLLSLSADPNAKNANGQTALHFAASRQNLDVAWALLGAGASARLRDARGQMAVHRAAAVGSVPMVRLLIDVGKSPLNAGDVDGMTALHHAVCEGHGDAAMLLLVMGAEFDRRNADGAVALDLAPDAKTRRYIVQAAEREGIDLE